MNNGQPIRLGELLVERGVLTEQQVFEIIETQKREGKPFGVLAEMMFEVTIESIEEAWTEQYLRRTGTLDLRQERFEARALNLMTRRQAWQFQMLPVSFDHQGELLIVAAKSRLARAVTFVHRRLNVQPYFRIASDRQIEKQLNRYYSLPCMQGRTLHEVRGLMRAA